MDNGPCGVNPDTVSMDSKELGHDPRHLGVVEALSVLAREEAWQKLTREHDRILDIWGDAMRWCVKLMSSEPDLTFALHYL